MLPNKQEARMYYVGLATINDRRKLDVPFVVNHSQFGGPLPTSPHRAMTSWMVAQDQFSGPSATRIGSSPRSIATLGAYSRSRLVPINHEKEIARNK